MFDPQTTTYSEAPAFVDKKPDSAPPPAIAAAPECGPFAQVRVRFEAGEKVLLADLLRGA